VWKREYAVKIAEEVYGNLFKEVKSIISSLEEKIYIKGVESAVLIRNSMCNKTYFQLDANSSACL